jgi:2,3-bisphosphoglycerate-dependent phosphoglycerate mutase
MATLVLLRHGQSDWNLKNLFTGWVDVDLTAQGEAEAVRGGELLAAAGVLPDVVHTSLQQRAIRTAELSLRASGRSWIPVRRSWRLNERHYGALQGKDKLETTAEFGADQVKVWRRSYDVPPPPLEQDPSIDIRYAGLPADVIPRSECLADVVDRMLPYWYDGVVPDLTAGRTTLVAAHGNSLRGLAMHLEGLTREEVLELNIPTGQPRVYELDDAMQVVSWRYLDPEGAAAAAAAVAKQAG